MATQLFLLDTVASTHLGTDNVNLLGSAVGWTSRALGTARGSGVVASDAVSTVAGATNGLEVTKTDRLEWISPPVSADVTIAGTITVNIWAAESSNSANVAINAVIEVIRANATATRNSNTIVQIAKTARTTEVALTTRAVNNFTVAATSTVVNRGDRLRVRVFGDDSTTMGSGFTFNASYNGASAAADGDTYVSFTETFSFESAPSGSVLYLTDTGAGLSTAPALVSDFTGADENPLSEGGNWAKLDSAGNALQRTSNAATSASAIGAGYWTAANFGPDVEAYVTLAVTQTNARVLARVQGEGGAATFDGYVVSALSTTTDVRRFTDAVSTLLRSTTHAFTWANGDKLGIAAKGSTIQAWRQASGSSEWDLICSAHDTTYASAGKVALSAPSTTVRFDDFYAATNSVLFAETAWTSRGSGVTSIVSDTLAGFTAPLLMGEWYTPPLAAFTLGGLAVANLGALESNALANASLRCQIARVAGDGTSPTVWGDWAVAPTGTDNGELTTSEVARTVNVSGDDLAISDGQRLRIRVYIDDISSAAMAASQTVTFFYAGTSAAASGDSYITLPQTVTQYAPASTVIPVGFAVGRDY